MKRPGRQLSVLHVTSISRRFTRTLRPLQNRFSRETMSYMTLTSPSRPNEQRRIEKLLAKLALVKPISAKPAPIASGIAIVKTA